jgi:hypothetical protein
MMAGRYAHAKQFNRHRRELRILRIRLGRIIRGIRRKIAGDERWKRHSPGRYRGPIRFAHNSSASAAGNCIRSMPGRWNAPARERLAPLTNSV